MGSCGVLGQRKRNKIAAHVPTAGIPISAIRTQKADFENHQKPSSHVEHYAIQYCETSE